MVARGVSLVAGAGAGGEGRAEDIPTFFAGRSVFITGATGFMGKVLVERLLYTCPEIGPLYLLMRTKKDTLPEKRLQDLKESPVFSVVRTECPARLHKLRLVAGDAARPALGIAAADLPQLADVSVVFHCAASVRFDETLHKATQENVRSVERLLDLCDALPAMRALVHVSTAYCNAELSDVSERVYPAPLAPHALFALTDHVPEQALEHLLPHLLGEKPNTYTFTKAIAETVLSRRRTAYPKAIFRPTIVINSLRTPFPGWIENYNGPAGLVVASGKGLLHTFHCDEHLHADLIPVDIAIDTMIAVAWKTAMDDDVEAVPVYNCAVSRVAPTWRQFTEALKREVRAAPFDHSYWYPSGFTVFNRYLFKVNELALNVIPLHLAGYLLRLLGIKPKLNLITVSNKMRQLVTLLRYFGLHEWRFRDDNVRALRNSLVAADRRVYNLDPASIDWNVQFRALVRGTRKYLLGEKDEDMQKAKQHLNRMYYIHIGMKFLIMVFALRLVLKHSEVARQIFFGTFKLLLSLFANVYKRVTASS